MKIISALAVAGALTAAPALASSCGDRISALDAKLNDKAESAISTSSAGQGVAGAREGQAMQADPKSQASGEPAAPFQNEKREAEVTAQAAEAGGGGDRVMQAKAALNRARNLDKDGDASGCEAAVAEVERTLEPSR